MIKLLLVMLGGAVGSGLRFGVAGWGNYLARDAFPVGTLAVNVVGCFAIGLLGAGGAWLIKHEPYRLAVMVGVLGGFTTFSSFGFETFRLMEQGRLGVAMAYLAASNGLGLAAVWAGYRLAG